MPNASLDYGVILPTDFPTINSHKGTSAQASFDYEGYEIEPIKEQALWQSVIMQAVLDATSAPTNSKARKDKTKAIIWFSLQNADFQFVCEMAGMNPLYVIRGAKKAIKNSSAINKRKSHMKRMRNTKAIKKMHPHEQIKKVG